MTQDFRDGTRQRLQSQVHRFRYAALCFPFFHQAKHFEYSLPLYSCSCTIALPYSSSLMSATAVLCLAT
jgi:hypothetical protein